MAKKKKGDQTKQSVNKGKTKEDEGKDEKRNVDSDESTIMMTVDVPITEDLSQKRTGDHAEDRMNFFDDGVTPIDFVLVWETKDDSVTPTDFRRDKFFDYLKKSGIHMEQHNLEEKKENLHFMLISIPWEILCSFAEKLNMRAPIQIKPSKPLRLITEFIRTIPCFPEEDIPRKPQDVYTCPFQAHNISKYENIIPGKCKPSNIFFKYTKASDKGSFEEQHWRQQQGEADSASQKRLCAMLFEGADLFDSEFDAQVEKLLKDKKN
ncbi:anoctamin-7-like [Discoglossus pictus]